MNTGKASSSRGPRRKSCSENLDRFILNRSAMDWDYAHYMLTEGKKGKGTPVRSSPANEAYRKALADSLNMIRTRILAFKDKPPTLKDGISTDWSSVQQPSPDVGSPEVAGAKVSAKEAASVPFADLKYIR